MLVSALPLIAEELNLSQSKQAWVVDAYALPFPALLMIAGGLGDRYGRRGALLAGTALFGMGSVLSATADSGNALLASRAVMGVGSALIMPGTLSAEAEDLEAISARGVALQPCWGSGAGTVVVRELTPATK
jgi:MFS family permease